MGKGEYDNGQSYPYNPGYDEGGYPMDQYPQTQQGYGGHQTQTTTNVIQVGAMQQPRSTTVVVQQRERMPGMCGHICFSCIVFWIFNPLFGCIAFFIAIGGLNAGSPSEAKSLGRASLGMNIAGLLIGLVIWVFIILAFMGVFAFGFYSSFFN